MDIAWKTAIKTVRREETPRKSETAQERIEAIRQRKRFTDDSLDAPEQRERETDETLLEDTEAKK